MTRLTVGVVGPGDLVEPVATVASEVGRVTVAPFRYEHEDEAPDLVRQHQDEVDCWLFTGIVPQERAAAAGVLRLPAEHVSYSGATLLGVLVRLLREGRDTGRGLDWLSVDTLAAAEVRETLDEAGLADVPADTLPHRPDQHSDDVVAFHRDAHRRRGGTGGVALTCLRSAYEVLDGELPTVRMAPSRRDTREAVTALLLKTQGHRYSDAQVALGLIELDGPEPAIDSLLGTLGASVVERSNGSYLLVTTRGPLHAATDGFTRFPLLASLGEGHGKVHMGIGLGRSAAEAETLARRALGRARESGPVAAAFAQRDDNLLILDWSPHDEPAPAATTDLAQLAQRAGMSRATLLNFKRLLADRDEGGAAGGITAADVAASFGINERSARRLLKRLERAGVALASSRHVDGPGRPSLVYEIKF